MSQIEEYIAARDKQVLANLEDRDLRMHTHRFFKEAIVKSNYAKNFTWMGVPILQLPSDLMVMQEIIWKVKPDIIIETGVAFGGMSKFYSNMLSAMGDGFGIYCIDIDTRPHTKEALRGVSFIHLIESSSIDPTVITKIHGLSYNWGRVPRVLVSLDSNHTHDHVLAELRLYSPLVSVGSYIVVFDTTIEEFGHVDPENNKRPWGPGNNPYTAVRQFLQETDNFVVDKEIAQRALITAAPGGWLRRVK